MVSINKKKKRIFIIIYKNVEIVENGNLRLFMSMRFL